MAGNPIVVNMIGSTIDKTILDIKEDPKKGIQNLAKLAKRYANNTQEVLAFQSELTNPASPYYQVVNSLVNHVDHLTLRNFIIYMAYNSLTFGRKRIRQYNKAYNYNISWTIVFDFTKNPDAPLNSSLLAHIIGQGKRIGIYTYMFFTNQIDEFSEIARRNPDCAFILYVAPEILTQENILKLKAYHNTCFAVLYQAAVNTKAFKNASQLLYDNRCLFGSYSYYENNNIDYILSNIWIKEIAKTNSLFGFLVESEGCSPENASLIHSCIDNSRINPQYPVLLIDLYRDIDKVGYQLSERPGVFKVKGDKVINGMNLVEVLSIKPNP